MTSVGTKTLSLEVRQWRPLPLKKGSICASAAFKSLPVVAVAVVVGEADRGRRKKYRNDVLTLSPVAGRLNRSLYSQSNMTPLVATVGALFCAADFSPF